MSRSHVVYDPKRGFEASRHCGAIIYVREGYQLVKCTGEAHSNAFIDNCPLCASGLWGWKAVRATSAAPAPPTHPSYEAAVQWIADNDAPGDNDSAAGLATYTSVALVADVWGKPTSMVAIDVWNHRHPVKR